MTTSVSRTMHYSNNRQCSYCNQPGHTINNCIDESIPDLCQEIQDAADFSIAYSGGRYLKALLHRYTLPKLKMLGYHMNLSRVIATETMTLKMAYCEALGRVYLTDRLQEPGIKERLRQSLSRETVAGIRQRISDWTHIGILPRSQRDIAIERVRIAEQNVEQHEHMLDNMHNRLMQYQQRYNEVEQHSHRAFEELAIAQDALDQLTHNRRRHQQRKFDIKPVLLVDDGVAVDTIVGEKECPICYDSITLEQTVSTNCKHSFCSPCLSTYLDGMLLKHPSKKPTCALCREITTTLEFKDSKLFNAISEKYCIRQNGEGEGEGEGDSAVAVAAAADVGVSVNGEGDDIEEVDIVVVVEPEVVVEWAIDRNPEAV